ncbi:hypothetical protein SeLEV6574_g04840 [Synchytrium endobioticum]|nr:hypothetical protein SeLEV6574_g04840 [Synchytrium endobioticum]
MESTGTPLHAEQIQHHLQPPSNSAPIAKYHHDEVARAREYVFDYALGGYLIKVHNDLLRTTRVESSEEREKSQTRLLTRAYTYLTTSTTTRQKPYMPNRVIHPNSLGHVLARLVKFCQSIDRIDFARDLVEDALETYRGNQKVSERLILELLKVYDRAGRYEQYAEVMGLLVTHGIQPTHHILSHVIRTTPNFSTAMTYLDIYLDRLKQPIPSILSHLLEKGLSEGYALDSKPILQLQTLVNQFIRPSARSMHFAILLNYAAVGPHRNAIESVSTNADVIKENLDTESNATDMSTTATIPQLNIYEAIKQAKAWSLLSKPSVQLSIFNTALKLSWTSSTPTLEALNVYTNLRSHLRDRISPAVTNLFVTHLVANGHVYSALLWITQQSHTAASVDRITEAIATHKPNAGIMTLLYAYIIKHGITSRAQLVNYIRASSRHTDSRTLLLIALCMRIPIPPSETVPIPAYLLYRRIPSELANDAVIVELVKAFNALDMHEYAKVVYRYWASCEKSKKGMVVPLSLFTPSINNNTPPALVALTMHPSIHTAPPCTISNHIFSLIKHTQPYTRHTDMTRSIGIWPYAARHPVFVRDIVVKAVAKGIVEIGRNEVWTVEHAVNELVKWVDRRKGGDAQIVDSVLERELLDPLGAALDVICVRLEAAEGLSQI